jgi:hypothetical protein
MVKQIQNNIHEVAFITQLRLNSGELHCELDGTHHDFLLKRKGFYDNNFKITPQKIKTLTKLNKVLKKKEEIIYQSCMDIEERIITQQKNKYTDYEIKIVVIYYSDKIANKYKEFVIDYIYTDSISLHYTKKEHLKKNQLNDNWSNFTMPQKSQFYGKLNLCRTLFSLMEYSYLSLDDILQIDNILWDIKVEYRFKHIITKHNLNGKQYSKFISKSKFN